MVHATAPARPRQRRPLHEVPMPRVWIEAYCVATGLGILSINRVPYAFRVARDARGEFTSARLVRTADDGATKQIDVTRTAGKLTCDCEDATYNPDRPRGCKHVRTLEYLALADSLSQDDDVREHDPREHVS